MRCRTRLLLLLRCRALSLLTPEAMGWGLGGAMLLSFGLECLFRLIDWVVLGGKRLRQSRPIEERDLKGL